MKEAYDAFLYSVPSVMGNLKGATAEGINNEAQMFVQPMGREQIALSEIDIYVGIEAVPSNFRYYLS